MLNDNLFCKVHAVLIIYSISILLGYIWVERVYRSHEIDVLGITVKLVR